MTLNKEYINIHQHRHHHIQHYIATILLIRKKLVATKAVWSDWYKKHLLRPQIILRYILKHAIIPGFLLMKMNELLNWWWIAFCGMVERRKAISLISSRDHCQRSSPLRISNTLRTRFEPEQNPISDLAERISALVITTTSPCRYDGIV